MLADVFVYSRKVNLLSWICAAALLRGKCYYNELRAGQEERVDVSSGGTASSSSGNGDEPAASQGRCVIKIHPSDGGFITAADLNIRDEFVPNQFARLEILPRLPPESSNGWVHGQPTCDWLKSFSFEHWKAFWFSLAWHRN